MTGTPNAPARRAWVRDLVSFLVVAVLMGQWMVLRALHVSLTPGHEALFAGLGIFGAAFLLSWGAELAELELSQALALALLALMAVLPEYAVDMYLAWKAAHDPSYTAYAAANMTGANRILIGLGWPVVLFCSWGATRKREICLEPAQRVELVTLLVATLYAFTIPLRRSLSLLDTVCLVGLFVVYLVQSSKAAHVTPELSGPPVHLAVCPRPLRRFLTVLLFVIPGLAIFLAAEPFANGLLQSARHLGVEEFVLIQWLAPLASESPEFIVAILFAARARAGEGLGTLISSKVNQWTLLIGMLPLVYSISGGHVMPMHLDARQNEEIFLTVAQSLLAVIVLVNGRFGLGEGVMLAGLFLTQLLIPSPSIRLMYGGLYILISLGYLMNRPCRASLRALLLHGFRAPS